MNFAGAELADAALLGEVCAAVREVAARHVMPRFRNATHSRKEDGTLVTEADLETQAALVERLQALVAHPVLGEEMTPDEQGLQWDQGEDGLWCIDPIDGTSNFVRGVPYFAVSVALMRRGRSELGVVFAPLSDELFEARRGHGSFLNGERLGLGAPAPDLRGAMANVDFRRIPRSLGAALAVAPPYCSHRSLGAATLEWCYLAAGRLDIYVHGGQKLWDYAAGSLILEEAGGRLGTLKSDDFWAGAHWKRSVVAARHPALYDAWRGWLDAQAIASRPAA